MTYISFFVDPENYMEKNEILSRKLEWNQIEGTNPNEYFRDNKPKAAFSLSML